MDQALMMLCLLPASYAAYVDAKERICYDAITYPIIVTGLIYAIYTGDYKTALLGGIFGFSVFLLVGVLFKGGIGGGDVKLATGLGLWFGLYGLFYIILISSIFGVVWDLIRMYRSGRLRKIIDERITPNLKGAFLEYILGVKGTLPEAPEDIPMEDSIPLCTFMVIIAWFYFIFLILVK